MGPDYTRWLREEHDAVITNRTATRYGIVSRADGEAHSGVGLLDCLHE
jgi:hypothetical protein